VRQPALGRRLRLLGLVSPGRSASPPPPPLAPSSRPRRRSPLAAPTAAKTTVRRTRREGSRWVMRARVRAHSRRTSKRGSARAWMRPSAAALHRAAAEHAGHAPRYGHVLPRVEEGVEQLAGRARPRRRRAVPRRGRPWCPRAAGSGGRRARVAHLGRWSATRIAAGRRTRSSVMACSTGSATKEAVPAEAVPAWPCPAVAVAEPGQLRATGTGVEVPVPSGPASTRSWSPDLRHVEPHHAGAQALLQGGDVAVCASLRETAMAASAPPAASANKVGCCRGLPTRRRREGQPGRRPPCPAGEAHVHDGLRGPLAPLRHRVNRSS
jgi:hypothetical protein